MGNTSSWSNNLLEYNRKYLNSRKNKLYRYHSTYNCSAGLIIGQTVKIYVRNPDVGRQINSFSGKSFFDVILG